MIFNLNGVSWHFFRLEKFFWKTDCKYDCQYTFFKIDEFIFN